MKNLRPEEIEFIDLLKYKNINTFVDVGANVGDYSESIIESLNPANVSMYEPIESCYEKLKEKFPSQKVHNCIVSDANGEIEFHEAIGHEALSSCVDRDWLFKDYEMKKSFKKSACLDSEGYDVIDFLKIDTEGYELNVLKGCRNLLSEKKIRFIQFEYGGCFKDLGIKLNDVIEYLKEFGYGVYKYQYDKFTLIENFEDDYEWLNYFAFVNKVLTPLEEIAQLTGTDKLKHDYLPYYEKHLPDNPLYLLEIGAFKGASLVMWDTYYKKVLGRAVNIHTMDLFDQKENITERWCLENSFVPFKGDQGNFADLDKLPKSTYDVIIEDGSHNSIHQIKTMAYCFLNNLRSGGVWVTEDLHCCKNKFYWSEGVDCFEKTLLYFLKNMDNKEYMDSINEANNFLHFIKSIKDLFADVKIYDDKIAFITKK